MEVGRDAVQYYHQNCRVSQADIKMQTDGDGYLVLGQVLIVSGKQFSDSRQPPMVSAVSQPVRGELRWPKGG